MCEAADSCAPGVDALRYRETQLAARVTRVTGAAGREPSIMLYGSGPQPVMPVVPVTRRLCTTFRLQQHMHVCLADASQRTAYLVHEDTTMVAVFGILDQLRHQEPFNHGCLVSICAPAKLGVSKLRPKQCSLKGIDIPAQQANTSLTYSVSHIVCLDCD